MIERLMKFARDTADSKEPVEADRIQPGNWHEDAGHENGSYQRQCLECGALFVGHKRRHICRKCHHEAKEKLDKMTPEERAALMQRVDAKVRSIFGPNAETGA